MSVHHMNHSKYVLFTQHFESYFAFIVNNDAMSSIISSMSENNR